MADGYHRVGTVRLLDESTLFACVLVSVPRAEPRRDARADALSRRGRDDRVAWPVGECGDGVSVNALPRSPVAPFVGRRMGTHWTYLVRPLAGGAFIRLGLATVFYGSPPRTNKLLGARRHSTRR